MSNPGRNRSFGFEEPLCQGRTAMWSGNSKQAFYAPVRIEVVDEISGIEPAHAMGDQGKNRRASAEKFICECFRTFRYGSSARDFRYKGLDIFAG